MVNCKMKPKPEQMMMKRHLYNMMLMKKVEEQVKLNRDYQTWKDNATMNVRAAANTDIAIAKGIGCIGCLESIKDNVVVISEIKKIKDSLKEYTSETNIYICPKCLDQTWEEYKNSVN